MTYHASAEEKQEIGRLMLELSDTKRKLEAARAEAAEQDSVLQGVADAALSGHVPDDWPSPDQYKATRAEIARLEERARELVNKLKPLTIQPDTFDVGVTW